MRREAKEVLGLVGFSQLALLSAPNVSFRLIIKICFGPILFFGPIFINIKPKDSTKME